MFIDSHCHLSFEQLGSYSNSSIEYINYAKENNIKIIVDIATTTTKFAEALSFAKNKSNIINAIGIHPLYISQNLNFKKEDIIKHIKNPKLIAIGETGLDYYRAIDEKDIQKKIFEKHCEIATKYNFPVIIHTRNAKDDTIEILKYFVKNYNLKGVIHCFSEDIQFAKQVFNIGFYISFSGILTFKNANILQDVARYAPIEAILAETDAPYLAPNPYRGKINQPAYVKYIYDKLAIIKNIPLNKIENQIEQNFFSLFPKAKTAIKN